MASAELQFSDSGLRRLQKCPDLGSHGDVGDGRDASTGLWLLVLGSSLFKHLLPLTKRHDTPGRKTDDNFKQSASAS